MVFRNIIGVILLFFLISCSLFSTENKQKWLSQEEYSLVPNGNAEIIFVKKIWDNAVHNAFTDLKYHNNNFYLTFREGKNHHSMDGKIRVLKSKDGITWQSDTLISNKYDLRDPKLSISPSNKLYLFSTGRYLANNISKKYIRIPYLWSYDSEKKWSDKKQVYPKSSYWLWNMRWFKNTAYSIGSSSTGNWISLFKTNNKEETFVKAVENIYQNGENYAGKPSEADILFLDDSTALTLLRRNGHKENTSLIGYSKYPFHNWSWKPTDKRIGGPKLLKLPDRRIVAGVRLYQNNNTDGNRRTSLCWFDPINNQLKEFLELPSGSDTGYPGLSWHEGHLWVSYYSTHEGGKTSIYIAKVKINKIQ